MPMCRIKKDYHNAEGWRVGDEVDITNPETLIREGKVVMLNDRGEEIAPPGTTYVCPVCMWKTQALNEYGVHILRHTGAEEKKAEVTESAKNTTAEDELKKRRLENLQKARDAMKLKKLEQQTKNALQEAQDAMQSMKQ